MRGKIFIINKKSNLGKVIFTDNKESSIIEFPKTFEHGDNIEIEFAKNDITQKPIKMVAHSSEKYYGFIMNSFGSGGNILVTYPKIVGLINFKKNQISSDNPHPKVKFIIKKTLDSKLEAIQIEENNNKKEFYKSQTPKFGKLKSHTITPKEGFISDIIKTKNSKNSIEGIIKAIRDDKGFGFISISNDKDIYFRVTSYKKFYQKSPHVGDVVNFTTTKTPRGLQVTSFNRGEEFLTQDKQYGIIDKHKFLLKDFYQFYQKEPEIGDIIHYFLQDGDIQFTKNPKEIKTTIFKQTDEKNIKNIEKGKIKVVKNDKNFGFISLNNSKDAHFKITSYKKTYKKDPKAGDKVTVLIEETQRGFQVKEFVKLHDNIKVSDKAFKDFVDIDPNSLYYAYIQNNIAKEVYRYEHDDLSQSISCYNDRSINKKFKLLAIDCLINSNYTNKKISLQKLKEQKRDILNNFVLESIKNSDFEKAIDYESILQMINYNPKRLSKIADLSNKKHLIESSNELKLEEINNSEKIEIITNCTMIKDIKSEERYQIDLNHYVIKEFNHDNSKWNIKLKD